MAQPPEPLDASAPTGPRPDPVLARRRRLARLADLGQRAGYGLYGTAVVLFVVALVTDLPPALVTAVVVAMAVGSAVLAPSIIVGYGVRAADRDDRERANATAQRAEDLFP